MTHFLKTFHRIDLWVITYNERKSDIDTNVDIDVGSDVAIKMKYTH